MRSTDEVVAIPTVSVFFFLKRRGQERTVSSEADGEKYLNDDQNHR